MNADHSSSSSHYLGHFAKVFNPINPKITKFSTPSMTIEYGSPSNRKEYTMKFDPPMYAGEARHRLGDLHHEAMRGLGISEVIINKFNLSFGNGLALTLSSLLQIGLILIPSATLAIYSPRAGQAVSVLLNYLNIASSPTIIGNVEKLIFLGTLNLIHLGEALVMLPPLFYKYNTTSFIVKTQYFLATIVAGFHIWRSFRTEAEVEEAQLSAKASEKKH